MPRMDGITLARQVKRWVRVPLIAITAFSSQDDLRTTFEAGSAARVTKPVNWDSLLATIERLLPPTRPAAALWPRR
jgi:DNA-binding response OmpR family regulator